MADVVFYQKPGCRTNARQTAELRAAGHAVSVRDLLQEPWTAARLRPFFGDRPVAAWFNPPAPKVKSGEIKPEVMTAEAALALMLAEPLLIRRPLLEAGGACGVGFDAGLGVLLLGAASVAETCSRTAGSATP